jgi:hypothetical protein
MRKVFTLLTMCLLAATVWGQTVITFIPGQTTGNNETAQGADSMTKDGITISTTSGGLKAAQYRFAKGSVTTVSSAIGNIISIEFTCSASGTEKYGPGCFASQTGYSYEGNVGTWVGSAESVEFTAESNQVRATQIVVTVGEAGLAKPTINPASGTFYAPIEVNITCGTNGAKIYYTTNGSDPSTSSTQFTAPFTVSSNTTVKAISAKDGEVSDVVSAEYTFATATAVNSIAAFQNAADGTVLVFNNPVTVLAQSGLRMFVQDNTGRALFYGDCGQTYKNGDVIPAGFVGSKTTWDGEPELQNLSSFKAATSNSPVDPATITTAQVEASRFAQYVYLEEVTFDKANKLVKDAAGQASYYCNMNVKDNDIVDGATYNLWAIVGSHGKENTVYQLLPVDLERIGGGGDLVGFGNLPEIEDNTEVTMGYEITVLGQQGSYLYAMDETGFGLIYGSAGQTYAFGDVAPGNFTGKKVTWDGEPELQSPNGLKAATRNIGANLTPNSITPAQVGHNIWGQYVVLMGVTIDTGAKTLNKNGESCAYYDRFGVDMPSDGQAHDVYGIVASYGKAPNTVYQILPLSIDEPPVPDTSKPDVRNLQELYQLPKGKVAHFTMPLTAIFQSKEKRDLYIIDADGKYGLVYGDVDGTFVNGDYVNDAEASWTTYNDNPQLSPVSTTFVPGGFVNPIAPVITPIEEVSQDMVHWYLGFENVNIVERTEGDRTNYYMVDETGELMLFDRYNIGIADYDKTKTHYIEGFLTVYRGTLELYPIPVNKPVFPKGDVNGDGEVTIADVNALLQIILGADADEATMIRADVNEDGEIGLADVNEVINIILS